MTDVTRAPLIHPGAPNYCVMTRLPCRKQPENVSCPLCCGVICSWICITPDACTANVEELLSTSTPLLTKLYKPTSLHSPQEINRGSKMHELFVQRHKPHHVSQQQTYHTNNFSLKNNYEQEIPK